MTCRLAVEADVPVILALLTEMAAEAGRSIRATEAAFHAHGFGAAPRFRAVLAEEAGAVQGLALVFPEFSSWRGEPGLYVQDLYVRPAARSRGLARALLAAAWEAGADWRPAYLTLMVDEANATGKAWYAARGFTLRERGDLLVLRGEALERLTGQDGR